MEANQLHDRPVPEMPHHCLYVRASPGGNDGEAQLYELRRYLEESGCAPWREFLELGVSGDAPHRPVWESMISEVRRGKIQTVAVTELSRISRIGGGAILETLDVFRRYRTRLIVTRLGVDYETAAGRIVAAVLGEVAAAELADLRQRIRAGIDRAREVGTRSGNAIGRPEVAVDVERLYRLRVDGNKPWAECVKIFGLSERTLARKLKRYTAGLESDKTPPPQPTPAAAPAGDHSEPCPQGE